MSLRVEDNLPTYKRRLYASYQNGLLEAARDILITAKSRAPFDDGRLRGTTQISTPRPFSKRISFLVEYARFQEYGGDGKRRVRQYTTPGTGAHYLKRSGDEGAQKLARTLKKHGGIA